MPDVLLSLWTALAAVPHLRLYLTLAWLAYLVGLGVWIVLQKREPVATLSWLLGLAALPYLGLVIYLVFGPRRLQRYQLRRARVRADLPGRLPAGDPDTLELARLAEATTGLPPTTATRADWLVDSSAA